MGWASGTLRAIGAQKDHKLKTCPFCGHAAQIEPWHGGPATKVLISCSNDACRVGPSVTGDTRASAVRVWNKRR